jgi:hypothetical protein
MKFRIGRIMKLLFALVIFILSLLNGCETYETIKEGDFPIIWTWEAENVDSLGPYLKEK